MTSQEPRKMASPNPDRYHGALNPQTPEPFAPGADEQSLPPLRPRLKLKRRHASQINAPTQHFLASIAAADVPIPSVEDVDRDMINTLPEVHVEDFDNIDICRPLTPRMFSPPKTPARDLAAPLGSKHFPDWYRDATDSEPDLESDSDYESSRPSTAFSTQTSSSLSSLYSHATDDLESTCISPDLEAVEFPHQTEPQSASRPLGQDKRRKALWTKAMSSHLWKTWKLYRDDPKVTPMRLGRSCIPPHGVCTRVARQAQRSWKGAKGQPTNNPRSRNSTPTVESTKTYIKWPHTPAATRSHLRELCRMEATNKLERYLSRSPTPFNKAVNRHRNRRSIPARSPSVFSSQDMAMSLTLSASDTMQLHGPLAQLTSSQRPPMSVREPESTPASAHESHQPNFVAQTPMTPRARDEVMVDIDDPFTDRLNPSSLAKSYGPSSSSAAKISLPKQPNTVGGPRGQLMSPVPFTGSRPGTQKRKSVKGHDEKAWKRPSLAAAFFREGSRNAETSATFSSPDRMAQHTPGCSTTDDQQTALAPNSATLPEPLSTLSRPFAVSAISPQTSPFAPVRLGSPLPAAINSSHSFPNRLSSASHFSLASLRKPFATVQQRPVPTSPTPTRPSLASRLAYLDQRLKDFRNRGTDGRRSQSPM
ncbi:hypothetical protein GGR50DRAFT_108569 [Xylaria sp. CBS 124048]|nr:hypothetical protein GGR50DRAFT_108569 [Xylaria sp. CBS 124048]